MRHAPLTLLALVLLSGASVEAKSVKYAGLHPRTGKPDGGLCYIETVHVHSASPFNEALYRQHNGVWLFIGDPVPFGFDGPKERYYGHHPVTVRVLIGPDAGDGTLFCYLEGPHWHQYEPPDDYKWKEKEDVYYYAGDYPPEYEREKERYAPVNVVYRPIVYERPVVVGPPPGEYHGPILDVRVHLPVPVIGVQIGTPAPAPGVILVKEKHFKGHKFKKFKGKRE